VRKIIVIILLALIITGYTSMVYGAKGDLMTKDDFKIFVEMFNKRFDDVNKRFDDVNKRFEDVNKRFDDVNKRFDFITKVMIIGFSASISFTVLMFGILYKVMEKRFEEVDKRFERVDKRFEQIEKRFEQVDAVLLLLVKAHKNEIGDKVIDLTMGRVGLKDITDEMIKEIEEDTDKKEEALIEKVISRIEPIIIKKIETSLNEMQR